MIEVDISSLSYKNRSLIKAFSCAIDALWEAGHAVDYTPSGYDDVYNILIEASCRLRAARERLYAEVYKIAKGYGAKAHEAVSFVSEGAGHKWIYATIVVGDNEDKEQP